MRGIYFLMAGLLLGNVTLRSQDRAKITVSETARAALYQGSSENKLDAATESKLSMDEIIRQVFDRERHEIAAITLYRPILETYVQILKPDKSLGVVPKSDFYFLAQADFNRATKARTMLSHAKTGSFFWSFDPNGFLEMSFIDKRQFNQNNYKLQYAGRGFLGDVRCLMFDVSPVPKGKGTRFVGRIWVEDLGYTIIRINGRYSPGSYFSLGAVATEHYFHFDSWRTNVQSGLWLPSYVYIQRLEHSGFGNFPNFKAQTRLWGYKLAAAPHQEEFTKLTIESFSPVNDNEAAHDRSPIEAQREWRHEAENNAIDVLEKDGLLAPSGPVDKVLDTVVNNLEITNNLDSQVDLHCRVLLTSTLEMFSIGNTIVMSRGLIDVLPDEGTLAVMLAHEIADAMVPKPYQDEYGFNDVVRLSSTEVMKRLSFRAENSEVEQNSQRAFEILRNSPYVNQLGKAGLFFAQLHSQAQALRQLISPRLGNGVFQITKLVNSAPTLEPNNKDQIAALPLGSRVKIDPWTNRVDLLKSKQTSLLSAREKMPFEITHLVPYVTRYQETSSELAKVAPMQNQ